MAFEVTPASVDDREGLRDFAEDHLNLVILGNKGYTGEALSADMQNKGICLMSLRPSNYKKELACRNTAVDFLLQEEGGNGILAA